MRPYVVCHMMSSLDGRTDPEALGQFADAGLFERTHPRLEGDAWLAGRITLQADFSQYAEPDTFRNDGSDPVGKPSVHVAQRTGPYGICADTKGRIRWLGTDIDGDHVVALVSERASTRYLALLRERDVSYVAVGKDGIDFHAAFGILAKDFGVKRLLVEGGGTLNGAVLREGLIDELSLLLLPGIDGRRGPRATFDGGPPSPIRTVPAKLVSLERLEDDVLWLRYSLQAPRP